LLRLARLGWDKYAQLLTLLIDSDEPVASTRAGTVKGHLRVVISRSRSPGTGGHGRPEYPLLTSLTASNLNSSVYRARGFDSLISISPKTDF
jgi:hypothetical protein